MCRPWSAPGVAEVTARYVLHLLHGVPIEDEWRYGRHLLPAHTHTLSPKASATRAITTLAKGGHLAYQPGLCQWPGYDTPK